MNQRGLPIWQPLSEWRFRALWIASIGSNCGSWIYTITVQWQVTSISTSPLSVSMVLVAANLPQFLFLLPAGVLCDLVDRRRLLIASQMALAVSPLLLGAALLVGYDWLGVLLAATFVIGVATAFSSTALQTIVPEIAPREQLLSAVALNSVSINVSRSVGPAIGGAVVAASGALAGFVVSAISGLGTYLVALRLPAVKRAHSASMAQLVRSMKEGLNFVYSTPRVATIAPWYTPALHDCGLSFGVTGTHQGSSVAFAGPQSAQRHLASDSDLQTSNRKRPRAQIAP